MTLMKTTIQVNDATKVRGTDCEWVVWVMVNDSWRQYGVYESQETALEYAGYAAKRTQP
jgi:hypothetical protein